MIIRIVIEKAIMVYLELSSRSECKDFKIITMIVSGLLPWCLTSYLKMLASVKIKPPNTDLDILKDWKIQSTDRRLACREYPMA